jgi:ATP-dependent protease ClpP protease subunit
MNPLAKLLGRDKRRFVVVNKADADAPSSADVLIYEDIGESFWGDGVTAKSIAAQITGLDVDELNVRINSVGGEVYEGLAIQNALIANPAKVNVTVDGIAASAASVIAMAGDHVSMARGAMMMIHDPSMVAVGNPQDLRDSADTLDKIADSLASTYAARAGGDVADWRALMQAETWYTADEAVDAGLADDTVDGHPVAALDTSRVHARAGRPMAAATLPAVEPEAPITDSEGGSMEHDKYGGLVAGLRDRLGLADAEPDELLAAVDDMREKLAAKAEPNVPEGLQLVDSAAFAELQAKAEQGAQAAATLAESRREAIVEDAVQEGRIAPANRATWLAQLEQNEEGTVKLLSSLPKNTIPVKEIGHAKDESEEDALYASIYGKKA